MTQSSWPVSTRGDLGTNISSREIARPGGAPPRKGRQIRRLPETSGWVFIVVQTEKYCFIAFYADKVFWNENSSHYFAQVEVFSWTTFYQLLTFKYKKEWTSVSTAA